MEVIRLVKSDAMGEYLNGGIRNVIVARNTELGADVVHS